MKISSSEISSFISYVHVIVYETQIHETATLTFFLGTFVLHLYKNHHKKEEKKKSFIPQPARSRLLHPLLGHKFWGNKEV